MTELLVAALACVLMAHIWLTHKTISDLQHAVAVIAAIVINHAPTEETDDDSEH